MAQALLSAVARYRFLLKIAGFSFVVTVNSEKNGSK